MISSAPASVGFTYGYPQRCPPGSPNLFFSWSSTIVAAHRLQVTHHQFGHDPRTDKCPEELSKLPVRRAQGPLSLVVFLSLSSAVLRKLKN